MSEIDDKISSVVADLKDKIDIIANTADNAPVDVLEKINTIKHIVINVLIQASNKVSEITNECSDEREIEEGINVVRIKSKKLFDDAIIKINEIYKTSDSKPENDVDVNEDTVDYDQIKVNIDESIPNNYVDNNISSKAVNILRSWLNSEGK